MPHRPASVVAFAIAATALLGLAPSHAAAPLNTDDPDVLEPGQCELEPYIAFARAGTPSTRTLTAQAGCGVGAHTQLGLGAVASRTDGDRRALLFVAGKTALGAAEDSRGLAWALAWGADAERDQGRTRTSGAALALLGGWSPRPGTDLRLNLGHATDAIARRRTTAWGLAVEQAASPACTAVAEAYGDDRAGAWWNAGLRWQARTDLVVGVAWARSWRTAPERALSLGVTLSR